MNHNVRRALAGGSMMQPEAKVITVGELAVYLHVHRSTLYRLLKKGQLPAFKIGSDWRFNVEAIDRWRMQQPTAFNAISQNEAEIVHWTDYYTYSFCKDAACGALLLERDFLHARGGFHLWTLFMETVLIVDDEAATRDILVELLHKDGREIVTAGDGREALERLTELPRPCLIVLDLMMLGMNGFEFLRRQSTNSSIAKIPTIVLFGFIRPAGARHQLSKPVDVGRLLALVDQYCWLRRRSGICEFTLRPIYIRGFRIYAPVRGNGRRAASRIYRRQAGKVRAVVAVKPHFDPRLAPQPPLLTISASYKAQKVNCVHLLVNAH
jgi:excisionase family DNA binding protein